MEIQLDTANLTEAQMEAIIAALDAIPANASFLIALTDNERQSLLKAKNKRIGFIEDAHDAANAESGILPRDFDLDEYNRYYALYTSFKAIETHAATVMQRVSDTALVIRSILMQKGLQVYAAAKIAGRSGGMEGILDRLAASFKRTARKGKVVPE